MSKPHIGKNAYKYIKEALDANEISKGSFIKRLETKFARYTGFKYASSCSNGTMALFLALRAFGIEDKRSTVLLPGLTFAATADAILMAGGNLKFLDIFDDTFSLRSDGIDADTAIVAVDLYGVPSDISYLKKYDLPIIRDACESLGAQSKEKADITCYSFFGNKVMTSGEGGMCCTDNKELYEKIEKLKNHGRLTGYWHELRGTNARMSNITAALALSQLEDIKANLGSRKQIFKWYYRELADLQPMRLGAPWLFVLKVKNRDKIMQALTDAGFDSREGFKPLYQMPAYKQNIHLSNCEQLGNEILMLPCYPGLKHRQVQNICKIINAFK